MADVEPVSTANRDRPATEQELAAEVARLRSSLAEVGAQLGAQRQHAGVLSATLARSERRLTAIEQSWSWRATAPWRSVRRAIEQLVHGQPLDRFDPDWYLKRYPEAASAGCAAEEYFALYGAGRGHQPNAAALAKAERGTPRSIAVLMLLGRTFRRPRRLLSALGLLVRRGPAALRERWNVLMTNVPDRNYASWLARYDASVPELHDPVRRRLASVDAAALPRIALLMVTGDSAPGGLEATIASVRRQAYVNWELCIADDSPEDPGVAAALQRWATADIRIHVAGKAPGDAASRALTLVSAPWVALVDPGDLLHPQALEYLAEALLSRPDARLVYTDTDRIDTHGRRQDPHFKPEWNRELLYSCNVLRHLLIVQTALLREIGGFQPECKDARDHDLVLRITERLRSDQVVHLPYVLYHECMEANLAIGQAAGKAHAPHAGIGALNRHFERCGIAATAEADGAHYRTRFALPSPAPKVSILIPTRNALALVRQCIESLLASTTYPDFEILLIDNGSDDPDALAYFAGFADSAAVRVLPDPRPFNYSALNNAAARQAGGEYLCLLNNDITVITPGWLEEMVSLASLPGVGAVGARLWYPNDTLQHAGVVLGLGGVAGHAHVGLRRGTPGYFDRERLLQEFSAVTAACLVVRKSSYEAVGGLNETDLTVAYNDVDFCLRLREAGLRNVWTPHAELYHHESATRGQEDTPEKRQRFDREVAYMQARWGKLLTCDPAYNPNLTLETPDFALAFPPRTFPAP